MSGKVMIFTVELYGPGEDGQVHRLYSQEMSGADGATWEEIMQSGSLAGTVIRMSCKAPEPDPAIERQDGECLLCSKAVSRTYWPLDGGWSRWHDQFGRDWCKASPEDLGEHVVPSPVAREPS